MAGLVDFKSSDHSANGRLFIVSSDVNKADPTTRKLIRSHVMRGKKRKKTEPVKKRYWTTYSLTERAHAQTAPITTEDMAKSYAPLMPGRIGSELSFIEFADDIEPSLVLNIAKVSMVAMKVIFPLMVSIGFHSDVRGSLYPIVHDAATLHITAFAVDGFVSRVLRRESSYNAAATLHLLRGMKLLRERLLGSDDMLKISDSTMSAVLKLASTAHFDGDSGAAKLHIQGLRNIVFLRGGLDMFRDTKFLMEMLRCDLSIAILDGSKPVFFCQPSEPIAEYPEELLDRNDSAINAANDEFLGNLDEDLVTAWFAMRKFCLLVNLGTQTKRMLYPKMLHGTMSALIYRLVHMGFNSGSIDEMVRLGLLAFSYHVFLQWQGIRLPYAYLPTKYQKEIQNMKPGRERFPQMMLWLLMVGGISLFDISDEAWLGQEVREHAERCQVKTWKAMQEMLKSFMWIPLLDEEAGKKVYAQVDGTV